MVQAGAVERIDAETVLDFAMMQAGLAKDSEMVGQGRVGEAGDFSNCLIGKAVWMLFQYFDDLQTSWVSEREEEFCGFLAACRIAHWRAFPVLCSGLYSSSAVELRSSLQAKS